MAQKEKDHGFLIDLINSFLSNKLVKVVKGAIDEAVDKTKESVYETQRKILTALFFTLIVLFGVTFIFIGGILLLNYYLKINLGWCFVIGGFAVVIIAILFKFFRDLKL
jgi:hypothetical protein